MPSSLAEALDALHVGGARAALMQQTVEELANCVEGTQVGGAQTSAFGSQGAPEGQGRVANLRAVGGDAE